LLIGKGGSPSSLLALKATTSYFSFKSPFFPFFCFTASVAFGLTPPPAFPSTAAAAFPPLFSFLLFSFPFSVELLLKNLKAAPAASPSPPSFSKILFFFFFSFFFSAFLEALVSPSPF